MSLLHCVIVRPLNIPQVRHLFSVRRYRRAILEAASVGALSALFARRTAAPSSALRTLRGDLSSRAFPALPALQPQTF